MSIERLVGLLALVLASMAAGWLLARRKRNPLTQAGASFQRTEYFKGLNFLVNEQPDKAIEVFIRMVEVDSDTVETHFALASLFRRRGEVDRAIRLHQNLIARPNLTREHRNQALRELGNDYMGAGLFDRAESLFLELTDARPHMEAALGNLVTIYEQQKDWEQAVAIRRKLEAATGVDQNAIIAHYFCELAAVRIEAGDHRGAIRLLKRAQAFDRNNVRVGIMMGASALKLEEPRQAVRYLRHALQSDVRFASEILPMLARAYRQLNASNGLDEVASLMTASNPEGATQFAVAAILHPELSSPTLERCVDDYLRTARALQGLHEIMEAVLERPLRPLDTGHLGSLKNALRSVLAEGASFRCTECGFAGTRLYWQCPSCRSWGSTTPYFEFSLTPHRQSLPPVSVGQVRVHGVR